MKNKLAIKLPAKELVKLESFEKFAPIPKKFKASGFGSRGSVKGAVVMDKKGTPKYFIFDTYALWDLLCVFDAKYEENVPAKEYVFNNPVGWLIDAIEKRLPVNPQFINKLRKGIEEAKKLGLVPFEKIKRELGIA